MSPPGVPGFNHKPVGILARCGTEWQGTVGTLMDLARLGGMFRVFAEVRRRERMKKKPLLERGAIQLIPWCQHEANTLLCDGAGEVGPGRGANL